MPKLTTTTIQGAYASTSELNANFAMIEVAVNKCLFRTGDVPNTMKDDISIGNANIANVSPDSLPDVSDADPVVSTTEDLVTLDPIAGQVVFDTTTGSPIFLTGDPIVEEGDGWVTSEGPPTTYDFTATLTYLGSGATTIECGTAGQAFTVDWGDGSPVAYTATTPSITPTGTIIVGSDANPDKFRVASDVITTAVITGGDSLTSLALAFYNLTNLTSLSIDDTSNVTLFNNAYRNTSITAVPSTQYSSATNMNSAFRNTNITSFPSTNFGSCSDFTSCWRECSALVSFGQPTYAANSDWDAAFRDSWAAGSTFPALNFSTQMRYAEEFLLGFGGNAIASGANFSNTTFGYHFFSSAGVNMTVGDLVMNSCGGNAWFEASSVVSINSLACAGSGSLASCFSNCTSLVTIGTITSESKTVFDSMFNNCTSLTTIGSLDTTSTADASSFMFNNCSLLTSPDSTEQDSLDDAGGYDYN